MAEGFQGEENMNPDLQADALGPRRYILISTQFETFVQAVEVKPGTEGLFTGTLGLLTAGAEEERLLFCQCSEGKKPSQILINDFVLVETSEYGLECPLSEVEKVDGIRFVNVEEDKEARGKKLDADRRLRVTRNGATIGFFFEPSNDPPADSITYKQLKYYQPSSKNSHLVLRLASDAEKAGAKAGQPQLQFVNVDDYNRLLPRLGAVAAVRIRIPPSAKLFDPRAIYVSGMWKRSNNVQALLATFTGFGQIRKCKPAEPNGHAYISFHEPGVVDNIIMASAQGNGITMREEKDGRRVEVRLAVERVAMSWEVAQAQS